MEADEAREYLLTRTSTTEETPFGPDVLVYKVAGKMFATLAFEDESPRMNLKCNPERALELRDQHDGIVPGYHMNKKHWNTLVLDTPLEPALVRQLIDHSWDLVFAGLPTRLRTEVKPETSKNPPGL